MSHEEDDLNAKQIYQKMAASDTIADEINVHDKKSGGWKPMKTN